MTRHRSLELTKPAPRVDQVVLVPLIKLPPRPDWKDRKR